MKIHRTSSSRETKALGASFASRISFLPRRRALVIALFGDLGSGKTTFVQGFLKAMGARGNIASPTFVLMKRYAPKKSGKVMYHLDLYRIRRPSELAALRVSELFRDPRNIILIEWAERAGRTLPRGAHRVRFFHEAGGKRRIVL